MSLGSSGLNIGPGAGTSGLGTSGLNGTFGSVLKTLQVDPNCVLIQDPSQVWGVQDFLPRRNLLLATDTLATQNVAVVATAYKLYMQGTGSITLSGTATGTLNGTGANDRVSLSFTPTAGTLTLTVSGTVTFGMLCRADTIDQTYQKITDWTTEQYAWAAQKNVPWLRRNYLENTELFSAASWNKAQCTISNNPVSFPLGLVSSGVNETEITNLFYPWAAKTLAASKNYWVSCFAKYKGRKYIFVGADVGAFRGSYFDLLTGTWVSDTSSVLNHEIVDCGDGVYLCKTLITSSSIGKINPSFIPTPTVPYAAYAGDTSKGVYIAGAQVSAEDCAYQPIAATWDETYTAAAIAAGYPIALWQDSAGTKAVNGDNQAIGACRDLKYGDYGPELVPNNQFTSNISGANNYSSGTGSISWSSGCLRLLGPDVSNRGFGGWLLSVSVGSSYVVTCSVTSPGGIAAYGFRVGKQSSGSADGTYVNNTSALYGTFSYVVKPTEAGMYVTVQSFNNVEVLVDWVSVREIPGYTAIQATAANQPKWRLDANGKPYIERDTVNDALPVTFPNLDSNCAIYVGNGSTIVESTGQTLNGSYAPITPTPDYGRVVFTSIPAYVAKVRKWLLAKAGY